MLADAAVLAETEKNSAFSRIKELEKDLEHAKESNTEFEQLKKDYKELEASGKAHDEELTRLLSPVAQGLSGNDPLIFVLVFNFSLMFTERFCIFVSSRSTWDSRDSAQPTSS